MKNQATKAPFAVTATNKDDAGKDLSVVASTNKDIYGLQRLERDDDGLITDFFLDNRGKRYHVEKYWKEEIDHRIYIQMQ